MSTSIWEGRARLPDLGIRTGSDSAADDTSAMLAAANNAMHWADQNSQVLVCDAGFELSPAQDPDDWYHLITWGPFNLRLAADGLPYPVRVRLAGRSSANLETSNFRLAVCAAATRRTEIIANGDNVLDETTTSSTTAWLGNALLTFTDEQTRDMLTTMSTIDAVAGDPVSVEVCKGFVTVFVQTTTTSPRLNGVYAAEFCGV